MCANWGAGPADFIKLTARHDQQLYFLVHELASNGGTLLDPLIDWCKSGLAFIDQGIPPADPPRRRRRRGSSVSRKSAAAAAAVSGREDRSQRPSPSNRATINVDELLDELPDDETRRAVLADARSLARWTRYKKAYSDICLRVDMLQAGLDGDGGDPWAEKLDKDDLYEDLLAQDRWIKDELVEVSDADGMLLGEGGLEWAWFAEPDVEAVASGERRKYERQQREKKREVEDRQRARANGSGAGGGGGGLFRTKSNKGKVSNGAVDGAQLHDETVAGSRRKRLVVPEPSVKATRQLLARYRELLGPALESARDNNVK
jgi:hypothetical protein